MQGKFPSLNPTTQVRNHLRILCIIIMRGGLVKFLARVGRATQRRITATLHKYIRSSRTWDYLLGFLLCWIPELEGTSQRLGAMCVIYLSTAGDSASVMKKFLVEGTFCLLIDFFAYYLHTCCGLATLV